MFLRVKTIEEFERTCLKIDDGSITIGYTIDKNDFFKFPYRIKKNDFLVPYWFFVENEKKRLEIE